MTEKQEAKSDEEFASFEKHSKGIGSALLRKMGFTGRLGKQEQGRVNPVEALLRPKGLGLGATDGSGQPRQKRQRTAQSQPANEASTQQDQAVATDSEDSQLREVPEHAALSFSALASNNGLGGKNPNLQVGGMEDGDEPLPKSHQYRLLIVHSSAFLPLLSLQGGAWQEALTKLLSSREAEMQTLVWDKVRKLDTHLAAFCPEERLQQTLLLLGFPPDGEVAQSVNVDAVIDQVETFYRKELKQLAQGPSNAAPSKADSKESYIVAFASRFKAVVQQLNSSGWRVILAHASDRSVCNAELELLKLKADFQQVVNAQCLISRQRPYVSLYEEVFARCHRKRVARDQTLVLAAAPLAIMDAARAGIHGVLWQSPDLGNSWITGFLFPCFFVTTPKAASSSHISSSAQAYTYLIVPKSETDTVSLVVAFQSLLANQALQPPIYPTLESKQRFFAIFSGDGQFYLAENIVQHPNQSQEDVLSVTFPEYGNSEIRSRFDVVLSDSIAT
eukprot:gb/GEZN01005844.1/.p1 GENE.gb/GEZN01005844.1/~~gb/GEZN01005844.1/.p1  ORF type:complete len:511 (-),score=72.77 gb/GEZN01005844.1/:211-1722(-)